MARLWMDVGSITSTLLFLVEYAKPVVNIQFPHLFSLCSIILGILSLALLQAVKFGF